jgi:hypothetical protein
VGYIAAVVGSGYGIFEAVCKLAERIIAIDHMVGFRNDIKTCLSEEVDGPSEFY